MEKSTERGWWYVDLRGGRTPYDTHDTALLAAAGWISRHLGCLPVTPGRLVACHLRASNYEAALEVWNAHAHDAFVLGVGVDYPYAEPADDIDGDAVERYARG